MGASSTVDVVRHPELIAILSRDRCTLVRPGVRVMTYRGKAAAAVETLLETVTTPIARDHLAAGLPGVDPTSLDRLVDKLLERGLLTTGDVPLTSSRTLGSFSVGRVLVGVCGAVQAGRLTGDLDRLVYAPDTEVQVVLTRAARQFVQPESLTHLYGLQPWLSLNEIRSGIVSPHIALASWADVVLILPATAHLFQRLATGAAADLLGLIAIATTAPVVIVPSMNEAMWRHPAVRRNVRQVIEDGAHVVLPAAGYEVATHLDGEGSQSTTPMLGGTGVGALHVPRLLRAVQTIAESMRTEAQPHAKRTTT